MKSDDNSDSEDPDDSQLIIVTTSNISSQIQCEMQNDDINNLYSDGIIENLWKSKAMGNYGPEEILVSVWFYISHYFGISSRTDHAKLCLGNIIVDKEGPIKKMLFNRNFNCHNNSKAVFNTRFSPKVIYETPNSKEKCPLTIFETYLSHRPSNFCYPSAPLYLQPDKSVSLDYDGPWFAAAGLGKNRIGALFNVALSKSGRPTIRHYNSRRQIIGDVSKLSPPTISPSAKDGVVESSPKIKLRICHLSSGNPTIVTHSHVGTNDESVHHMKKSKLSGKSSSYRKRSSDRSVLSMHDTRKEHIENLEDCSEIKKEPKTEADVSMENFDFSSKKFSVKPPKRIWSLQKSIVNITSRESNPIVRQIMMHLSMSKDPLLAATSDSKGTGGNKRIETSTISSCNSRLLRSNVKLHQLHLPLWPSIDKFCDSELQRYMKYSFDDERNVPDDKVDH